MPAAASRQTSTGRVLTCKHATRKTASSLHNAAQLGTENGSERHDLTWRAGDVSQTTDKGDDEAALSRVIVRSSG